MASERWRRHRPPAASAQSVLTRTDEEPENLFVYCVVEHKSTPDRMVGWQLLKYVVALLDRLAKTEAFGTGKLPMVVMLVVYNGKVPWGPGRRLSEVTEGPDGFRDAVELRYGVIDVGHDPPERLSKEGPLRGVLRAMGLHVQDELRADRERRRQELEVVFRDLREGPDWLVELVMDYVIAVNLGLDDVDVHAGFAAARPGEEEQMTSSFVQKYMDMGERKGRASMLLKDLERRFGTIPAATRERVQKAEVQQIQAWFDRAFNAESLEEVFEEQSIVNS